MNNRKILLLIFCSIFIFGLFTLVLSSNDGLQLINDDNNSVEVLFDAAPDANSPADITTTTSGTETIDWILYRNGGSTGHFYWVEKDGSPYRTPQSWSADGTELHIAIDRTVAGTFVYNITCNNSGSGMFGFDVVIVTVVAAPVGPLEIALIAGVSIGAIAGIGALIFIGRRR